MPSLVTLGSVPYNPYNTSLASIALQGLGMAQEQMRHQDALAQQQTENAFRVSEGISTAIQRAQENAFRKREADRADIALVWEHEIQNQRLGLAQQGLALDERKLTEGIRQFDISAAQASRQIDNETARVGIAQADEARRKEIWEAGGKEAEIAKAKEVKALADAGHGMQMGKLNLDIASFQVEKQRLNLISEQLELKKLAQEATEQDSGWKKYSEALKTNIDNLDGTVRSLNDMVNAGGRLIGKGGDSEADLIAERGGKTGTANDPRGIPGSDSEIEEQKLVMAMTPEMYQAAVRAQSWALQAKQHLQRHSNLLNAANAMGDSVSEKVQNDLNESFSLANHAYAKMAQELENMSTFNPNKPVSGGTATSAIFGAGQNGGDKEDGSEANRLPPGFRYDIFSAQPPGSSTPATKVVNPDGGD